MCYFGLSIPLSGVGGGHGVYDSLSRDTCVMIDCAIGRIGEEGFTEEELKCATVGVC